jgi:hypothetical protein
MPSSWDEWVRATVADVGWAVVAVSGGVPYAFTIGLRRSYGLPEVAMFGLREQDMQIWLNNCAELLRDRGKPFADGDPFARVIERFPVQTRAVHPSWHPALFGALGRHYGTLDVPVQQVVWPDRDGRWPWDAAATASCRERQPRAWIAVDAHPEGAWRLVGELSPAWPFPQLEPDATVMASPEVVAGTLPIVAVTRGADGGWDFLDERGYADEAASWVYFGELYKAQPWLARFADLGPDSQAWRDDDGQWHTRRFSGEAGADPAGAAAT